MAVPEIPDKPDPALDRIARDYSPLSGGPLTDDDFRGTKGLRTFIELPDGRKVEILLDNINSYAPVGGKPSGAKPVEAPKPAERPKPTTVDADKDRSFRQDTAKMVADAPAQAKATLAQIDKDPALRRDLDRAAQASGYPAKDIVALSHFESSGGKYVKASDDHVAAGVLQFQPSAFYDAVRKYSQPPYIDQIARYDPAAARAFQRAAPFLSADTEKGITLFDNEGYQKAYYPDPKKKPKHPVKKPTIQEDLARFRNAPFVQMYFFAENAKQGDQAQARMAHNYGATGAARVIAVPPDQQATTPVGAVISMHALDNNSIDPEISVQAFRERMEKPFMAVAAAADKQITVAAHEKPLPVPGKRVATTAAPASRDTAHLKAASHPQVVKVADVHLPTATKTKTEPKATHALAPLKHS